MNRIGLPFNEINHWRPSLAHRFRGAGLVCRVLDPFGRLEISGINRCSSYMYNNYPRYTK